MRPSLTFWFWFWLAIVGIVLLYPRFVRHEKARIGGPTADIFNGIKSALDGFKVDNGFYPTNLQDLLQQPSNAKNWHGSYFDSPKPPVDSWGHKYIYEFPGKHNPNGYDLSSAGMDGKAGTDDDIVNWEK